MNRVLKLLTNFFYKKSSKPLGRWNIEYCNKKIDNKIDLSNEDHCGPCGQYIITKNNSQNKNNVCDNNKNIFYDNNKSKNEKQ